MFLRSSISFIFIIISQNSLAQITNTTDCSDIPLFDAVQRDNQTREELLEAMSDEFVEKISDQDRCQDPLAGAGASGGGGGGGGVPGTTTSLVEAPNSLSEGKQSTVLDASLSSLSSVASIDSSKPGSNGRQEQDLLEADADAQQITELKAAISDTEDPAIKKYLQDRLDELSGNK